MVESHITKVMVIHLIGLLNALQLYSNDIDLCDSMVVGHAGIIRYAVDAFVN